MPSYCWRASGKIMQGIMFWWPAMYSEPPVILAPLSNVVASLGSEASFIVQAEGTVPLTFQWQFNGQNLPGATNSWLSITNIEFFNAGDYNVTVSNANGTASSKASMEVLLLAAWGAG